jgi:hypothetical protein
MTSGPLMIETSNLSKTEASLFSCRQTIIRNDRSTMELPRVNPIGIIESPDSYEVLPRKLPIALRLVAAAILIAFTAVGTITTVVSLGAYCLTSHAGTPSPLDQTIRAIGD